MKRIPIKRLVDFGVAFLVKRGVSRQNAEYLSKGIVETEAFRLSTHGLGQFSVLDESLGKTIDPKAEPKVVEDSGGSALVDGNGCIANLSMKLACELAVEKAHVHGIGFTAVRRSSWIGALGTHLISIAQAGLLAQAWAQTNTCKDCAPFGGIDATFSTNPVALAFPTDGDPVIADFSTATMSMGGAHALIDSERKAKVPRFLDNRGIPTNDPGVINNEGSLMFIGGDVEGHKGYALSLWNEALTVLSGGSANNPELPSHQCFALMVLNPERFVGSEYYLKEMKRFINHVRSSRARPGFDSVRLPGERGFASLNDCRKNGIPLSKGKIDLLNKIAQNNGLEFNMLP